MNGDIIALTHTESGKTIPATVYNMNATCIQVVLGQGLHSSKCSLFPTSNGKAYAGSIGGRELVYHRSPSDVQRELNLYNPIVRRRNRW